MDKLIAEGIKVDAVITDPPYNISKKNNYSTLLNKNGKLANRQGIDFGEWDKGFDLFSYIDKVERLVDSNGSFIVFMSWKQISNILRYTEERGFVAKDLIRIEKSNPMPRNRDRRYIVDFEIAIWFVKKGAKWTFNRQDEKYERPKFVVPVGSGLHPTQKNLSLMEWLIKIHTNKNDTILDPFAGSGTTLMACKSLGRNYIGIELSKDYCEIARARIDSIVKPLF